MPRRPFDITPDDETQLVRSLLLILAVIVTLISGGVLGYSILEKWSFLDSLYMTLITLATVGFEEVHPLSPAGRVFTCFLIAGGIGVFAYSGARLVSLLVEGELKDLFEKKRRRKMIQKLNGHHIVCGCGRVGGEVVHELLRAGQRVVVVENDSEQLKREVDVLRVPFVLGSATERDVIEQAGIERAASLVTCLPDDAANVYICLSARAVRKDLHIISRANSAEAEEHLKKAGADRVVSPYALTGHRMALLCIRPAVTRFLDSVSQDFKFEEVHIREGSPLAGKAIRDSGIRKEAKAIVVAILNRDGNLHPNPDANSIIQPGDTLVLLGSDEQLAKVEQLVE